ncbi:Iron/Zinc purple acid phosphatase-like protein [Plakobranchus ocellatus]|uniref:Iron/Zinc purple acid phosphatase-like protein n=1 Tax=Plakobranchus ocellatus TaxID=259542 RepID=A0AAV4BPQ7_9GAST|nr:Iron/Zinc purple acid phosphatase-like protein [Plakobranchus ocellatus]
MASVNVVLFSWIFFLALFVTLTTSNPVVRRGFCLSLCGDVNNVTCPSGYDCLSNGCGHQCYRTTFQQPPGCPMMKCAYNCPLGFVRDENGCEGCDCDYSRLTQGSSTGTQA